MKQLLIDPKVTRKKFEKEVKGLLKYKSDLRKRGWIFESTKFPIVRVTFLATRLTPPIAVLTVDIDFTNYNLCPPSIRFLNPINLTPNCLQAPRKLPSGGVSNLMINAHLDTREPFLCLPGTNEYHTHPQHDGDSWDIHRYTGEGSLFFLLDNISKYLVQNISAFHFPFPFAQIGIVQEAVE